MNTNTLATDAATHAAHLARINQIATDLNVTPRIDQADDHVSVTWYADGLIDVVTAVAPGEPADTRLIVGGVGFDFDQPDQVAAFITRMTKAHDTFVRVAQSL